ncbi:uncharacterized protein B0H18DRAFT_959644 [Fomitopsis serialis]|uniref:uncharacterized protein n=1 Tax=Fomitopsis serialis TaxID=139415 RepID=UPI0020088CDB|nr:uncharacterized protein B0H18DRAFT_959644 [Neoantrodia serialis]KAH9914732.1 hypothetical protein B0H18DRAFT_959644 [Neoantrodia serialis]
MTHVDSGHSRDTLLFIHGFSSTSYDCYLVNLFRKTGYALIIPDMLGAGDTDNPTNAAIAADVIDSMRMGELVPSGSAWPVPRMQQLKTLALGFNLDPSVLEGLVDWLVLSPSDESRDISIVNLEVRHTSPQYIGPINRIIHAVSAAP